MERLISIGTLLVHAGEIEQEDLEHAISVSARFELPVGLVLLGAGLISDKTLNAVLDAQSHLRERIIDYDVAIKALVDSRRRDVGLNDVLLDYGFDARILDYTNILGQLLVDAEFVSDRQRLEALQIASTSNLPLGRILMAQKIIDKSQVVYALSMQILIRTGKLHRDHAIKALKISQVFDYQLEVSLTVSGFEDPATTDKLMLGQLLLLSGQLTELQFLISLERSLLEDCPLENLLTGLGYVTEEQLFRAEQAKRQIVNGDIDHLFAVTYLNEGLNPLKDKVIVSPDLLDILETGEASSKLKMPLGALLILCKLISLNQFALVMPNSKDESDLVDLLLEQRTVDRNKLEMASKLWKDYNQGKMNADELLVTLNMWLTNPSISPK